MIYALFSCICTVTFIRFLKGVSGGENVRKELYALQYDTRKKIAYWMGKYLLAFAYLSWAALKSCLRAEGQRATFLTANG